MNPNESIQKVINDTKQSTLKSIIRHELRLEKTVAKRGQDHPRCQWIRMQIEQLKGKISNFTGYKLEKTNEL